MSAPRHKLIIVPSVVLIVATAGVVLFILRGASIKALIQPEIFAPTYQFLLVIVIGSGVSVLFQGISYGREVFERRRVLQREIHQALVIGYNDAKRARRLLRARARAAGGHALDAAEYDRQLEAVSNAQLSIELATRRIEMNRKIFPDHVPLIDTLRTVGKYLNSVVDEWEDVRPQISASQVVPFTSLPELSAFLSSPRDASHFRDGFKNPFDIALRLLEEAVVADL